MLYWEWLKLFALSLLLSAALSTGIGGVIWWFMR
jgi:hypothetical protein